MGYTYEQEQAMALWNDFFSDTLDDAESIQNIIWQKSNGRWVMIVGDPMQIGRVMIIQVDYNPFSGERLERTK